MHDNNITIRGIYYAIFSPFFPQSSSNYPSPNTTGGCATTGLIVSLSPD